MRKLKLQMSTTLDGFVGRRNGQSDWLEQTQDEEYTKLYQQDIIDSADTLIMGRKMTDEFTSYWEDIADNQPDSPMFSFARKMVNIPKIVFSKTIQTIGGKNTRIENGDLLTVINNLKNMEGKDILVYGGADFVSSLIKSNLIDEYIFFVTRTAIGDGLRIFTDTTKLKLISSKLYDHEVIVNRYTPDIS